MGRKENRKVQKELKKKMTPNQLKQLQSDANLELINIEVAKKVTMFQELFTDCLIEAAVKNGISKTKLKMILDDVEVIIVRKAGERSNVKA